MLPTLSRLTVSCRPAAARRLSLIHIDAADDLIGVDLGGLRVIKKKKINTMKALKPNKKKKNQNERE